MTDARALVEEARRIHQDGTDHLGQKWGPWCYRCQVKYPCLPARLAEALEELQQEYDDYAEHTHLDVRLSIEHLNTVEAERDAAVQRAEQADQALETIRKMAASGNHSIALLYAIGATASAALGLASGRNDG